MKTTFTLLLSSLFFISQLFGQLKQQEELKLLMSARISSEQIVTNVLFFTDGSYSVQKNQNDTSTDVTFLKLSSSELKSLKKLIKASRPLVLRNKYSCNNNEINKYNSVIYSFSESNKTVLIDKDCKTTRKLDELLTYINNILSNED